MKEIEITDEYIKLGQAMKLSDLVSMGSEAKELIWEGLVKVNGDICTQRGKKLYPGDTFEYDGEIVKIVMDREG